ncbi:TetR/AcrR family transcriptional regulator [Bradyrhizobium sp. SZCCHNS3002]|uniref:TetR/AcrR family transcriptional regulator n=1 Tax=Bradyrhizobium sp. SZCCHNS3002 TaxID=3057310 RepID=UPI0028F05945|nr:TetR family transcriptional regulator [Bradyrhizobium sp. SZCCHNS3002]
MDRSIRTGKESDDVRARILATAEGLFRRVGHHRTSVADIAAELGMSPANIYRFFPSRVAIEESICGHLLNEIIEVASSIARTDMRAAEKLAQLLTTVHHHTTTMLIEAKPMHDLIVIAIQENWPVVQTHVRQILVILEAIIREGVEAGEFDVQDATQAAQQVRFAFMFFFYPAVVELHAGRETDIQASMIAQISFILKALGDAGEVMRGGYGQV